MHMCVYVLYCMLCYVQWLELRKGHVHVTPDSLLLSRSLSDPDEIWCVTSRDQDLSTQEISGQSDQ